VQGRVCVGERSREGHIKSIPGAFSTGSGCRPDPTLLVPAESSQEAAVVQGVTAYPFHMLPKAVGFLNGTGSRDPTHADQERFFATRPMEDDAYGELKGHDHAKPAPEIAAAGGHNLLMVGPPGSGKTMFAERLPTILPLMEPEEAIETTRIHRVSGQLSANQPLLALRPVRAPDQSISDAALIGGGTVPKPGGRILRAQWRGVLRRILEVSPPCSRRIAASTGRRTHDSAQGQRLAPLPCAIQGDRRDESLSLRIRWGSRA